ncbi:MAG: RidA family protein [Leptolyngbya sp. SIO1D8]|nr:RidA family protein [Leptolyngbya sp. SIO1D8]
MQIERKNYSHLDAPVGPYVHAVSYNGLLFLSGLTAFNTPAQGQDLVTQAESVFGQLKRTLEAEETGFETLIKVTLFVTEFADLDRFRAVLFNAYQDNLPASTLIQVNRLFSPDIKIEVEAIAAVSSSKNP